jgi:hypothetical protein
VTSVRPWKPGLRIDADLDHEHDRVADHRAGVELRQEHRDAQVDEHRDADGEQDALGDGHGLTRSSIT